MLKNALLFIIIFVLLIGFLYVGFNRQNLANLIDRVSQTSEQGVDVGREGETATRTITEVEASFMETQTTSSANFEDNQGVAVLTLTGAQEAPTAFTLVLTYDGDAIKVTKVEVGDIWEDANILQNVIDNDTGRVDFSAGQQFNTELTGGNEVARVYFEKTSSFQPGLSTITLDEGSATAYVGIDRLVLFSNLPIEIQVK